VENFGRDLIFFCVFLLLALCWKRGGEERKKYSVAHHESNLPIRGEKQGGKGYQKDIKASALQT